MATYWTSVQVAAQNAVSDFIYRLKKEYKGVKPIDEKYHHQGKNYTKHWSYNRSLKKSFKRVPYTEEQKHYANWLVCGCYPQFFRLLDGMAPDPTCEGQLAMGIDSKIAKKSSFKTRPQDMGRVANDVRRLIHETRSTTVRLPRCGGKGNYFGCDSSSWTQKDGRDSVNLMNYAGTPKKVRKAQAEENASKSKKKPSDRHPRLHIPLKGKPKLEGTLRVYLHEDIGYLSIHYHRSIPCQDKKLRKDGITLGFDAGLSEGGYDSKGRCIAKNLGKMSAAISDRRMLKDQRRQPLIAKVKLLKASSDPEDRAKARRIEHNNLHNKKETKKRAAEREQLVNYVRRELKKKVFVKPKQPAKTLVIENLGPMGGQKFGKRMNQRLSAWNRGDIITAFEELCPLYGVELVKVNPAYTSRKCSRCGHIEKANRQGDKFKCRKGGLEEHADVNAAKNILASYLSSTSIPLSASPEDVLKTEKANQI